MAKYLQVTGKILSRDNYREEVWNPEKEAYIQNCIQTVRVEYTVNGKIYTHNFTGEEAHGEAGEDYVLFYREDAPEYVQTKPDTEKSTMYLVVVISLALVALLIMICLLML